MKIKFAFYKLTLTMLVALFLSTSIVWAVDTANGSNNNVTPVEAKPLSEAAPGNSLLKMPERVIQDFQLQGLLVQFRYLKAKLYAIQFLNTGNNSIEISVLGNNYVLAPNDFFLMQPPTVKQMIVWVYPYRPFQTIVGRLLSYRFGDYHLFNLPSTVGYHNVAKSVFASEEQELKQKEINDNEGAQKENSI